MADDYEEVPTIRFSQPPNAKNANDLYYLCVLINPEILKFPFFKVELGQWRLTIDPANIRFSEVPEFTQERTHTIMSRLQNGVYLMTKSPIEDEDSAVHKAELEEALKAMARNPPPQLTHEAACELIEHFLAPENMDNKSWTYAENLEVTLSEYIPELADLLRLAKLEDPMRTCFKEADASISGVSSVMAYFGNTGTMSFYHNEDFYFSSASFMFLNSAAKIWLGFRIEDNKKIRSYLNDSIPVPCNTPDHHKQYALSTVALRTIKRPVMAIQRAGDIIFTNPGGMHQVLNTGPNYMEATNIFTKGVLPLVSRTDACLCEHRQLWHEGEDWDVPDGIFTLLEKQMHRAVYKLVQIADMHVAEIGPSTVETLRKRWQQRLVVQSDDTGTHDEIASISQKLPSPALSDTAYAEDGDNNINIETAVSDVIPKYSTDGTESASSSDSRSVLHMPTTEARSSPLDHVMTEVPEIPCSSTQGNSIPIRTPPNAIDMIESIQGIPDYASQSTTSRVIVNAESLVSSRNQTSSEHEASEAESDLDRQPQPTQPRQRPGNALNTIALELLKAKKKRKAKRNNDHTAAARNKNWQLRKGLSKRKRDAGPVSIFFKRKLESVKKRLRNAWKKVPVPGIASELVVELQNQQTKTIMARCLTNAFTQYVNGDRDLVANRLGHGYTERGLIADFVDYKNELQRERFTLCLENTGLDSEFITSVMASQAAFDAAFEVDREGRIPAEHAQEFLEELDSEEE